MKSGIYGVFTFGQFAVWELNLWHLDVSDKARTPLRVFWAAFKQLFASLKLDFGLLDNAVKRVSHGVSVGCSLAEDTP